MLEIRCGVADRSHENEFFRYFSRELKRFFDGRSLDGILLGMPTCTVMDNLQIDALLVTDSMIVIIDFKDYSGALTLPSEEGFFEGAWMTSTGIRVKGGCSPNPYSQLSKQRGKLKGLLGKTCGNNLGSFDVRHIKTMVCFQGEMDLETEVPRKYSRTFSVTDRRRFLESIFDAVNINREGAGLLNKRFKAELGKLFRAESYDCTIVPSTPTPSAAEGPQQELDTGIAETVREFVEGDGSVLILTCDSGDSRWGAAQLVQESAIDAGFAHVPMIVPTRKIAENLAAGYPVEGSLYSEIYDPAQRRTKDGVDYIPLRDIECSIFDEEGGLKPLVGARTLIIVCEAQLVSDSEWVDSQVVFGSGRLLADTLEYLQIGSGGNTRNKVVFIGDKHQLGYGSISQSCLSKTAYGSDVVVEQHDIRNPDEPASEIESFCKVLSDCIDAESFSLLEAHEGEGLQIVPMAKERWRSLLEDVARGWSDRRVIAYTNEKSNDLNHYIKNSILRNGNSLAPGDVLLVSNQFAAESASGAAVLHTVPGGSLIEVRGISGAPRVMGPIEGDDTTLALMQIEFSPKGESNVYRGYVFLDLLESNESNLSSEQMRLLTIRAKQCVKMVEAERPFDKGNPWFDAMIESGDYALNAKGEYRRKDDKSKLTDYERRYREDIQRALADSRSSEYFIIKNAMRAKYGWCVTAHKAMGYMWDQVVLAADAGDLGRHSEQYFRFLYTAASRARARLSIVRWNDINPFEEAVFAPDPPNAQTVPKTPPLIKLSSPEHAAEEISRALEPLRAHGFECRHIGSANYQERFELVRDKNAVNVAFSYNGKGEVSSMVRQKGDAEAFGDARQLLESASEPPDDQSSIRAAYDYLERKLGDCCRVRLIRSTSYRDEVVVSASDEKCDAAVYYNKKGLVTRVDRISGSRDVFSRIERCVSPVVME